MKPQINFDATLLAGATLDKLADGRWLINIATGEPQPASKPNGRPITGFSPSNVTGLYVRLNSGESKEHALVCVRAKKADGTSNGEKLSIGKLSDYFVDKTDGKKKYRTDDIVAKCNDLYKNGESAEQASPSDTVMTVRECLDEYLSDRMAKLDGDEIVKLNGTAITKSVVTLNQVVSSVKRYAHNWLDRCVTKITAKEIIAQAAEIRDGVFVNADGDEIGKYSTARVWLGTMSTIHKAGALQHGSVNFFEALRKKSYPKVASPQRRFTDEEIAIILNWELEDTPRDRLMRADVSKYHRVLAVKLELLTALRCGDLVSLKHEDIREHDGRRYLCKLISKGNRWQWFPITDRAGEIIDEAIELSAEFGGSEFIFPAAHGGAYGCGTKAFEVVRDMLVDLELIKPEPVEQLNKTKPEKRLFVSHDCRRTLETLGGAVKDNDGKRIIDQPTLDHMMMHKGSTLAALYNCKTEDDHIALADDLYPSYEAYADHLFEIAARS